MDKKIIVISGTTASGKSNLAINLAKSINGIIINADSMQIYDGLPILSAQPTKEDKHIVEHKLYGILKPHESNTVYKWLELAREVIDNTSKIPIVVGGTGMYISRFIDGIKFLPESDKNIREYANNLYDEIGWDEFYKIVEKIDKESVVSIKKNDKHRAVKIYEIYKISGEKLSYFESLPNEKLYNNIYHININLDREILYKRCEDRFKIMLEEINVIDEVRNFLNTNSIKDEYSITKTIGFKEIRDYLDNKISYDDMVYLSIKSTRNYAKRQYTWFKNQFKNKNFVVNDFGDFNFVLDNVAKWL